MAVACLVGMTDSCGPALKVGAARQEVALVLGATNLRNKQASGTEANQVSRNE
jgi:hypothetical protein